MKFIIIAIALMGLVSCATTPAVTIDSGTTFAVKFVKDGKEIDGSCTIKMLTDAEGKLVLDSFCTGFYSDDTGTYRCEIAVGSDGKPVTKNISISENCKLEIVK